MTLASLPKEQQLHRIEELVLDLMDSFEITAPPVPVELMLQQPMPNLWEKVDITQLSGSFLSIKEVFSPRMSLARLLVRHALVSPWGKDNELTFILKDEPLLNAFARTLLMPSFMIEMMSSSARNPSAMSLHFEVPTEDARLRVQELAMYQ
jgi:hypothetical protein